MLFRRKKAAHGIQGMTFGMMDAIINVIGIVIGLGIIGNKLAVFVAILIAGIANSLGNAAGFHVSEEAEGIHTRRDVWKSTVMTFVGTFAVTIILLFPLLIFELWSAAITSVIMGIVLLLLLGFIVSSRSGYSKRKTLRLMLEYLAMGIVVIIIAYYLGIFASSLVI